MSDNKHETYRISQPNWPAIGLLAEILLVRYGVKRKADRIRCLELLAEPASYLKPEWRKFALNFMATGRWDIIAELAETAIDTAIQPSPLEWGILNFSCETFIDNLIRTLEVNPCIGNYGGRSHLDIVVNGSPSKAILLYKRGAAVLVPYWSEPVYISEAKKYQCLARAADVFARALPNNESNQRITVKTGITRIKQAGPNGNADVNYK